MYEVVKDNVYHEFEAYLARKKESFYLISLSFTYLWWSHVYEETMETWETCYCRATGPAGLNGVTLSHKSGKMRIINVCFYCPPGPARPRHRCNLQSSISGFPRRRHQENTEPRQEQRRSLPCLELLLRRQTDHQQILDECEGGREGRNKKSNKIVFIQNLFLFAFVSVNKQRGWHWSQTVWFSSPFMLLCWLLRFSSNVAELQNVLNSFCET